MTRWTVVRRSRSGILSESIPVTERRTDQAMTGAAGRRLLQRLTSFREFNILVALLVLGLFLSITTDAFLTTGNLFGVARAFSLTAIVAIGQTMVILTGGIDLSVGSVLALAGLSTGMLLERGVPLPLAMLAGLGVGAMVGLVNGLLITRVGLPPYHRDARDVEHRARARLCAHQRVSGDRAV